MSVTNSLERPVWSQASHVFKFGSNLAVGTSFEDVSGSNSEMCDRTTADTIQVSSSSAADDSASTGVKTLFIQGLDNNMALQSETITMDGQTAAVAANTYRRLFRAYALTAGSGGTNAGDIYIHDDDTLTSGVPDANIYCKIAAGEAQSLLAHYTIPAGKKGYLLGLNCSSFGNASNYAQVQLLIRPSGGVWRVQDDLIVIRGAVRIPHEVPIVLDAETDIKVRAKSDANTVDVSASFDIVLENV